MSETTLGQLIDEKAERDAIHIAVAPVVAGERLYPGDHVGFVSDGIVAKRDDRLIGIVDPFLKKPVAEGQRFFLCLYPKTVTGIRHHWHHPAFAAPLIPAPDKVEAEKIIRAFCGRYNIYINEEEAFRQLVSDWGSGMEFFTCQGKDTPDECITDPVKKALAIYTGKERPDFFFSCTC